ncbi:uncharacterized protein N7473_002828 [Penicillium subrubescens]|uniref:Uncharacterized protein n=1 Tax=Penicillium subrubescens TaxID=1316194 RepID=A0A1Q5TD78_9EURO|nr:uncharacterized protein N7473_002828 [Penicillium subrubescens]KAJ5905912.1 hypothetical protein N7473_002828 [Penicillium subrubescens]OKO98167.1 hypothetical protein PENSUB_9265 [Penicillium subrubescens]
MDTRNATQGEAPEVLPEPNHPSQTEQPEQPEPTTIRVHAPPRMGRFSIPQAGDHKPQPAGDKGKARGKPQPKPTTTRVHAPPRMGRFSIPQAGDHKPQPAGDKGKARGKPQPKPTTTRVHAPPRMGRFSAPQAEEQGPQATRVDKEARRMPRPKPMNSRIPIRPRLGPFSAPRLTQTEVQARTNQDATRRKPQPFPGPDVLDSPTKGTNITTVDIPSSDAEADRDRSPTRQERERHNRRRTAKSAPAPADVESMTRAAQTPQIASSPSVSEASMNPIEESPSIRLQRRRRDKPREEWIAMSAAAPRADFAPESSAPETLSGAWGMMGTSTGGSVPTLSLLSSDAEIDIHGGPNQRQRQEKGDGRRSRDMEESALSPRPDTGPISTSSEMSKRIDGSKSTTRKGCSRA